MNVNHTLDNGLELLMFLANEARPHGVSKLSQALELPPSHVHRLLQTLVARGYVQQDPRRRYAIGIGALRLGHALLRDIPLRRVGLPILQQLARRTRWSAVLSVPFEEATVTVAHVAYGGRIRPTSETLGTTLRPGRSASGTLWLALQNQTERERVIGTLSFDAPNGAALLRNELEETADRDYGVKHAKRRDDSFGLAVPVTADEQLVAVLGVSKALGRPEPDADRIAGLVAACREAAFELQNQLHQLEEAPCPPKPLST